MAKLKEIENEDEAGDYSHLKPTPVLILAPEDIIEMGYDPSKMTQEEFNRIAFRIGANESLNETWHVALQYEVEDFNDNQKEECACGRPMRTVIMPDNAGKGLHEELECSDSMCAEND